MCDSTPKGDALSEPHISVQIPITSTIMKNII